MPYIQPIEWTTKAGKKRKAYRARHRLPGGRVVSESFATRADAARWLATQTGAVAEGRWVDPRLASMTLRQFVDEHYRPTMVRLRETTAARDESHLRVHIVPVFGDVPLGAIDYPLCQAWVNELASRRAAATVVKSAQILGKVLKTAVRAKRIASNPMAGVELPRVEESDDVYLTPAQIKDLADAMEQVDPRYRALVFVGAYAGPRIGELAALRWSDFDAPHRTLTIARSYAELNGRGMVEGQTKTKAGRRTVTLGRLVVAELEQHLEQFPTTPNGLIFPSPDGSVLRPRNLRRRAWDKAVTLAGLDPRPTFHDMRHTAVSLWVAIGATDLEIAKWAGHRSVSFTKDRYGHLFPEHGEVLADRLDALMESATDRPAAPDSGRVVGRIAPVTRQ